MYDQDDRICLNCKHWQVDLQLKGSANEKICRLGKGRTSQNDTCGQFMPASTFDNLQDPSRYHDKSRKIITFK